MRNDDITLQLYLIRHAESMGNIETDEEFDRVNPHLSAHGEKQVEALGHRFENVWLDAVYSSPLLRARKTAEAIGGNVSIDNRLLERDTAIENGVFVNYNESDEESIARAKDFIEDLKQKYKNGECVAVVSHGMYIQSLIKAALEIPLSVPMRFSVYNTSVTKINFRHGIDAKLAFQNDISHLLSLDGDKTSWM